MGYIIEIKTMQIHNGDEIKIKDDGNLVTVYRNGDKLLTLGKDEWYKLTRP